MLKRRSESRYTGFVPGRWVLMMLCIGGVALFQTSLALGASGELTAALASEASTTGSCGAAPALSAVGSAIDGIAETHIQRATCAGFPAGWLFDIDSGGPACEEGVGVLGAYFARARALLEGTVSSFSHAALRYTACYPFADAIKNLHVQLAGAGEVVLPENEKPILRFYFGDRGSDPLVIYDELTASLKAVAGPNPENWNVRIVVAQSRNPLSWNHAKLSIRDGAEVLSGSLETDEHEVAIHLSGPPAKEAQEWYDVLWNDDTRSRCPSTSATYYFACCSNPGGCRAPCATDHPLLCQETGVWLSLVPPVVGGPALPTERPVNVYSLDRGIIKDGLVFAFWDAGDRAIFAGIDAVEHSMFFFNPGLIGPDEAPVIPDGENYFSAGLLGKLVAKAAAGTDVKFVWGDPMEHELASNWPFLDNWIEQELDALGVPPARKAFAHCRLRITPYVGTPYSQRAHAKFFMLDKGFYVGSQNFYVTGCSLSTIF